MRDTGSVLKEDFMFKSVNVRWSHTFSVPVVSSSARSDVGELAKISGCSALTPPGARNETEFQYGRESGITIV